MTDILTKIYYSDLTECDRVRPENAERDLCWDALDEEIMKYTGKDLDVQDRFYDLVGAVASAAQEQAFKDGVRFAVSFMSEATRPAMKCKEKIGKGIS